MPAPRRPVEAARRRVFATGPARLRPPLCMPGWDPRLSRSANPEPETTVPAPSASALMRPARSTSCVNSLQVMNLFALSLLLWLLPEYF